jgi:dTMP kinase
MEIVDGKLEITVEFTPKGYELIKNKEYSLDAISKVLLFVTNRRELWLKIIEPALKKDFVVISDRNWWSTLAFEHYGFGVSGDFIKKLHTDCMPKRYMNPDFGFIMNLDENERVKRMALRDNNQAKDAFESQNTNFQKRVSSGYRKIAAEFNIPIIDAAGTPDEIHKTITAIVESCA